MSTSRDALGTMARINHSHHLQMNEYTRFFCSLRGEMLSSSWQSQRGGKRYARHLGLYPMERAWVHLWACRSVGKSDRLHWLRGTNHNREKRISDVARDSDALSAQFAESAPKTLVLACTQRFAQPKRVHCTSSTRIFLHPRRALVDRCHSLELSGG